MSMTLRDYILTCLPGPVDEHRLALFFEQPDVVVSMTQISQLTQQLVARYQQSLPAAGPPEAAVVEPPTPPVVPTEPAPADAKPAFSFLASEAELEALDPPVVEVPPVAAAPVLPPTEMTEPVLALDPPPAEPVLPPADKPEPVFSFLASEAELESTLQGSPLPDPDPVLTASDAPTLPNQTPDPVRFSPTNQAGPPAPQPPRAISIPNATVGKAYACTLDFDAMGLLPVADHSLSIDPATGLTYDPETHLISGLPLTDGEFTFELTYRLKTDEPGRPALVRRIQLLVNPDPRSLWKELPSDSADPYYKPDADRNLLAVGDVRLLAASVRGRSHAHEGKFRDDDFGLAYFPETGWYLLTVADGAGSARYSRKGAQLACATVKTYLQQSIEPAAWTGLDAVVTQYAADQQELVAGTVHRQLYDVLGKAVFDAYKTIETEAQANGAALKDYATTLITVLAKPVAGGWFVGAFWVGDGGVGIYHPDREPVVLGVPDGGEYAGQTRFLTMPETIANNFFGRFRFAFVPDFRAIILMTDGVTDPKFQTDSNLGRKEKWDDLWADLNQGVLLTDDTQAPAQLQDWLTFWSPGNHDDRTIALLYTHGGNEKD